MLRENFVTKYRYTLIYGTSGFLLLFLQRVNVFDLGIIQSEGLEERLDAHRKFKSCIPPSTLLVYLL